MYLLKCFILYSILGFIFESVVYKVSKSVDHSGVLHGPYTFVYGLGGMFCVLVFNYLNKFCWNIILKWLVLYILFTIICTFIEYVIGHLINLIFKYDKWNYTNHKYHFGKYICLDYALTWGLLASFLMYLLKDFLDGVIMLISNNATWIIFTIMIIDLIYTFLKKRILT